MTEWTPQAFSKNSTPVEWDEELLDEDVVIYLTGKNVFGDKIFSYLKLTLRNLQKLKEALQGKEHFLPSDFGEVLTAGRGDPTPEVRAEMAITYNMVEVPRPVVRPALNFSKPAFWDE